MAPVNFDRLFFSPSSVQLIRDHGMKFATDFKVIWDINQFPTYIREHFEVIFEDEHIGEKEFHEVYVNGRSVRSGPGVTTKILNDYGYYEAWLRFIEHHDQMALMKSRFSFADPAGVQLSLLYVPVGGVQSMYLGGIPTRLLESAELAIQGLQPYYCNDSKDLIMLATPINSPDLSRNIIRYYRTNEEYDLLRPVAFLHSPMEEGEGTVPDEIVRFIRGNQNKPWMHY